VKYHCPVAISLAGDEASCLHTLQFFIIIKACKGSPGADSDACCMALFTCWRIDAPIWGMRTDQDVDVREFCTAVVVTTVVVLVANAVVFVPG
jgi:hypothetical protein